MTTRTHQKMVCQACDTSFTVKLSLKDKQSGGYDEKGMWVDSFWQKQMKLCRTCWHKYVEEMDKDEKQFIRKLRRKGGVSLNELMSAGNPHQRIMQRIRRRL
jgi:hypothetical protein